MKKILSTALAFIIVGMTAFTAEAGIIDKCENPAFDTNGTVQAYRYEQPDGSFYGDTENGTAEGKIKLSSRDRQILYCMKLESGIENYSGTVFDDQYMNEVTAPFDDGEYEILVLE